MLAHVCPRPMLVYSAAGDGLPARSTRCNPIRVHFRQLHFCVSYGPAKHCRIEQASACPAGLITCHKNQLGRSEEGGRLLIRRHAFQYSHRSHSSILFASARLTTPQPALKSSATDSVPAFLQTAPLFFLHFFLLRHPTLMAQDVRLHCIPWPPQLFEHRIPHDATRRN